MITYVEIGCSHEGPNGNFVYEFRFSLIIVVSRYLKMHLLMVHNAMINQTFGETLLDPVEFNIVNSVRIGAITFADGFV